MNTREHAPTPATRYCGECAHFCNDPAAIETAFRGLTAMSSGHASVRWQDGLCRRHDLYLTCRDTCQDFVRASESTSAEDVTTSSEAQ